MKRRLLLPLVLLALCLLVVGVASATYTDAIGFRWDTSSDSPTLTRVFANGTTASVDGDYFNNHAIWGNIKKVLVDPSTGEVTYGTNNRGDGLDLNGTGRNQVMVEYPMFYTFDSYNAPFLTYIVSPTQYNSSFVVHPMFYQRGDGTPAAHYYVGAYEMQTEDVEGTLVGTSYTGKTPVVWQTIGTMRTYAEANGPQWGLVNVWTGSGIRELLYIETGTLNTQIAWEKSRGVVDDTAAKSAGADSADTNIFAVNATGGGTGTNGKTPEVWRALESSIGNVWEFWDGQNSYTSGGNSIWRNINRTGLNLTGGQTKFQDLLIAGDYETSTTATIADGYQTSVATGAADRLLMIPTGTGGSETTYLADYFYYPRSTNSGTPNVLLAGGNWDNAGFAGAGDWSSALDASHSAAYMGARLEFRPPPPRTITADFTASNTSGIQPLLVQFTDTSTTNDATIDSWAWDFGGGNISALQNPSHTYEVPGTHTANLTITNTSYSLVSSKLQTITVYNKPPVANFDMNETSGLPPLAVQFTDTSTGVIDSWSWDFGEGNTSILQNPEHTFGSGGEYQVNLTVTNDGGISTKLQNITVYCAEFSGAPTIGTIPLLVTFTDLTTGGPTAWNWSFGDGTFSELQNPTHTYTTLGTYTVNLTSTIMGGDCTESKTNYIIAGITAAPTVAFTANRTEGASPFVVQFTDQSTQSPNAWNWSFGGDGYSDDQNPIHTFATHGTYFVNLTATNPLGSGTLNRSAYITVLAEGTTVVDFSGVPTSGEPGILVQFTDLSIVTNTTDLAYNWSFGDGAYSDIIGDVQHVYSYASVYTVTLAISNAVSNESETKLQYIVVSSKATTTWYNPHDVTVTVLSLYGQPLEEVRVSANYNETTLPATWLTEYYGLQGGVASDALNATLFMNGYTGSDGAITYTMIKGIKYDFVLNSDTYGIVDYKIYAYTSDNYINFYVDTASFTLPISRNSTYSDINTTRIYVVEPDLYNVSMCIDYQDASGRTSSVTDRWIFKNNNTEMNATTFPPGITLNTHCYTIPNVRGTEVWWGWNATRLGV